MLKSLEPLLERTKGVLLVHRRKVHGCRSRQGGCRRLGRPHLCNQHFVFFPRGILLSSKQRLKRWIDRKRINWLLLGDNGSRRGAEGGCLVAANTPATAFATSAVIISSVIAGVFSAVTTAGAEEAAPERLSRGGVVNVVWEDARALYSKIFTASSSPKISTYLVSSQGSYASVAATP